MHTFFFGKKRLYGVYHEANPDCQKNSGIVLCHPVGLEYIRCYWAIKQLAVALAREGYHVIRFDYSHTGNSAGESNEADVDMWCEDIVAALQELQDIAAPTYISLVGLRFGALLAAKVSETYSLKKLILWEPVVSGVEHLQQLQSLNAGEHQNKSRYIQSRNLDPNEIDFLGFPYPAILRESMSKEFLAPKKIGAQKVIIIDEAESVELKQAVLSWRKQNIEVDFAETKEPGNWNNQRLLNVAFLPTNTLDIIVNKIQ